LGLLFPWKVIKFHGSKPPTRYGSYFNQINQINHITQIPISIYWFKGTFSPENPIFRGKIGLVSGEDFPKNKPFSVLSRPQAEALALVAMKQREADGVHGSSSLIFRKAIHKHGVILGMV
jgi:hypothetical protein